MRPTRFGPDPLRLYLAKEIPYGGDGDFTWERFEEKYNADLANNLGNLVNRVASMTERYQQGARSRARAAARWRRSPPRSVSPYRAAMDVHALHEGAAAAFRLMSAANNYIAETQPWALAKDPAKADRLNGVLADAAEAVRIAAVLLLPVMPASATEILRRLGDDRAAGRRRLDTDTAWRTSGEKQILNAGALWPRIEADKGVVTVTDENTRAPARLPQQPQLPHLRPLHRRTAPAGTRRTCRTCHGTCALDHDRRLHEDPVEGREGPRGRADAEVEEAGEAEGGRRRGRAAHDPGRHRRVVRARSAGGQDRS